MGRTSLRGRAGDWSVWRHSSAGLVEFQPTCPNDPGASLAQHSSTPSALRLKQIGQGKS